MANNVWFITGASKGLGLVLAKQLLERGHRVAATSRTVSALTHELGETSKSFLPLAMEITSEASVAAAVAAAVAHFGSLDVVVNNAGYGQFGTAEEVTDAEARRNFDVNVFGVLHVLRSTLPHLRERRSGHVFNIASIGGFVGGFTGWGVYCSTKFALAGLTESLRADLAPLGVGVTLVYPGYFRTSFLEGGSMMHPSRPIADYAGARASDAQHTDQINGHQPGDPARAMRALIDVYEAGTNPLHLFLGSDAVQMATDKLAQVGQELTALASLSRSTDFAAG
ncbi:MAG: SDR family NAD(P)-dependent oxidoreductase, partial [Myxococcales bacterium]